MLNMQCLQNWEATPFVADTVHAMAIQFLSFVALVAFLDTSNDVPDLNDLSIEPR